MMVISSQGSYERVIVTLLYKGIAKIDSGSRERDAQGHFQLNLTILAPNSVRPCHVFKPIKLYLLLISVPYFQFRVMGSPGGCESPLPIVQPVYVWLFSNDYVQWCVYGCVCMVKIIKSSSFFIILYLLSSGFYPFLRVFCFLTLLLLLLLLLCPTIQSYRTFYYSSCTERAEGPPKGSGRAIRQ